MFFLISPLPLPRNDVIVPHWLEWWQNKIYPWKQALTCSGPLALHIYMNSQWVQLLIVFKCACMCAVAGQASSCPRFTACQRTPLPMWELCALKHALPESYTMLFIIYTRFSLSLDALFFLPSFSALSNLWARDQLEIGQCVSGSTLCCQTIILVLLTLLHYFSISDIHRWLNWQFNLHSITNVEESCVTFTGLERQAQNRHLRSGVLKAAQNVQSYSFAIANRFS